MASPSAGDYRQRSRLALGVCVVALMFVSETVVVHLQAPNRASPIVWLVLGLTAAGAALYAAWCHRKWRSASS